MNARLIEAISACIVITIVALRRLPFTEAAMFGLAIFLIYLPGFLIYNYTITQKQDFIETHLASLAIGIALILIASFAAMQLNMKPSFITSIVIEGTILFIVGNIMIFKRLKNE